MVFSSILLEAYARWIHGQEVPREEQAVSEALWQEQIQAPMVDVVP